MPGLGTQITDNAHALAMGKVVLARLRPAAFARYVRAACPPTRRARSPRPRSWPRARQVREHGYAVDREEFDEDFCCVAAPVLDERGRLAAILGLSASTRAFDAEHESWPPRCAAWPPSAGAPAAEAWAPSDSNIVRKSTVSCGPPRRGIRCPHHGELEP